MTNFIFGNNNPVSGFKNKIINGDFRIWQRGTVFNPFATGYTTDRFIVFGGATENFITKEAFTPGQTEVPGNPEFYLKFNFSPVAQNRVLAHRIEDVHVLAGKTVTLSLWSKSMTNLTASLEFNQIFGSGGSPQVNIPTQSISLTPSWQRFSFTTTLPSVSGKTIGPNNYLNATVVRKLGGSNNSISIANVQIEEGSLATEFEQRPLGVELQLAQRYYYRHNSGYSGQADISGNPIIHSQHPVHMRTVPTVTALGVVNFQEFGNAIVFSQSSVGVSVARVSDSALALQYNNVSGMTASRGIVLISDNAAEISAEL